MLTQKGTLLYGVEKDGVLHKDFELRLPTLEDQEDALEAAGEGACNARVRRHLWARTLLKLGTIDAKEITPALLATLPADEYGQLAATEAALLGKLTAASAPAAS